MLAEDPRRAVLLAALGGDLALCAEASTAVLASGSREVALGVASDLSVRGFHGPAGVLFARADASLEAAQSFAAAGDAVASATHFERAGKPADAARVLESALRARPSDAAARLALGQLLLRHGRTEQAVKALQQLDPSAPERARALPLLKRALVAIGLDDAARTLSEEMERLGVTDEAASEAPLVATSSTGSLLFGRYQTVRDVAETPHARVLEAIDRVSGERVAVKLFAQRSDGAGRDALLRFEREARALTQLRHPNVVPLRAYIPEGPAIILAWMSGGSLADRIREPIAPARAIEITGAVLGALGEAHRLGILHRDVKPSNVMFDDAGTACLSDFGAAHLGDLTTTATAGAIGTFAYMSPEQRVGRPATLASDLYGVGVLLGELLTGVTVGPAIEGRFEPTPSSLHEDLSAPHDAIVARLLAEDPSQRPADAFEARRLLGSVRWSPRIVARAKPASIRPPSIAPQGEARLTAPRDAGDGRDAASRKRDTWLDRDVLVLPADPLNLERARAFARADHPSLPTVLRVEATDAGTPRAIWIAAPLGASLADTPRGLSPGLVARLTEAIRALHEVGGAHGHIDAEHLYFVDGEITLAFPRALDPLASAIEADRAALARLG
jgi:serine/threonine-protein kinase